MALVAASMFGAGLLVLTDQFQHFDDLLRAPELLRKAGANELADSVVPLSVRYYAAWTVLRCVQFAPFVTFLAATFTAARLHRSNETVAMLASGISLHRAFAPIFVGGLTLGLAQLVFRETVLPKVATEVVALKSVLFDASPTFHMKPLWVRDRKGNEIGFGVYRPDAAEGDDFEAHARLGDVDRIVKAMSARWVATSASGGGYWKLTGGEMKDVSRQVTEPATSVERLSPEFELTPHDCDVAIRFVSDKFYLSLRELDEQARRNPADGRLQILVHSTIAIAFANLILPLLGLPFLLRMDRRSTIEGIATSLALCVVYFGATMFCMELGVEEVLVPVVAGWLPVVVFGSLGIALFESMHT